MKNKISYRNLNIKIKNLTCNYLTNPLGVETGKPRLSWERQSHKRGQCQTAYQIIVSSNLENLEKSQGIYGIRVK